MQFVVRKHALRGWGLWAAGIVCASCVSTVSTDAPAVRRIDIEPSALTVSAGSSADLTAHAFDASGKEIVARGVFWSSQNPAVASVSQSGEVAGTSPGTVRVAASLGGYSATATVTVTPRSVALVRVRPTDAAVMVGRTVQLAADALDNGGDVLPGRTATWSSSATAIATVNAAGLVTGVAPGAATIRATIDGVVGTAVVTITAVPVAQVRVTPNSAALTQGGFVQLTATPVDAAGAALTGRVVTWTSSNQSVAVVSSTGRVQSVAVGSSTITATCEGVQGTAAISVAQVAVASIAITPANPNIFVGNSLQLDATVRDASGNILTGRTVSWSSSAASVATVSAAGVASAIAVGTATITASSGGVDGTTVATVMLVPVASVAVSPASSSLVVGQSVQLTATPKDAQQHVLTGRAVTWTTSNPAVASVTSAGFVTAFAQGIVTITATVDGVSGTAAVAVSAATVATLSVTPNPASVEEGKTVQLTATAYDANNNVLTGRTITWSSSNSSVATVASSGLVTGVAPGSVSITVAAPNAGPGGGTPTTTVPVSVTYTLVASVQVAPATASVKVAATVGFAASLLDANGQPLSATGRTVSWSSLNPAVATVDAATGLATGVSAGSTTVSAQASSPGQSTPVTGTASLTVTVPVVATVSVALAPDSIIMPGTTTGTATVLDNASQPIPGQAVTITSSNTSVATVSPSSATTNSAGQVTVTVTAVAFGNSNITASAGGKNGSKTARMLRPVASVTFSATVVTMPKGTATSLTVTARDLNVTALQGRPCSIASSNAAVASVSPTSGVTNSNGRVVVTVTAVAQGAATVTATCETKSATSSITVI